MLLARCYVTLFSRKRKFRRARRAIRKRSTLLTMQLYQYFAVCRSYFKGNIFFISYKYWDLFFSKQSRICFRGFVCSSRLIIRSDESVHASRSRDTETRNSQIHFDAAAERRLRRDSARALFARFQDIQYEEASSCFDSTCQRRRVCQLATFKRAMASRAHFPRYSRTGDSISNERRRT